MSEFSDSLIPQKNERAKFFKKINLILKKVISNDYSLIDIGNKNSRKPTEFLKRYSSHLKTEGFTVLHDLENLAIGIIQLINLVIDRDIDMIFFLDKSARPAYFLFLKVWQRVFPNLARPKIRFIEIGRSEKNNSGKINEDIRKELENRYGNLAGLNILVADEFVDTGKTLLKAKDIFSKAFTPKKILFTGIFPHSPEWYGKSNYLGVSEYDHLDDPDPHFLVKPNITPEVRLLRKELDLLAEQIAQSVYRIPKGKKTFSPYLSKDLDLNLNHT